MSRFIPLTIRICAGVLALALSTAASAQALRDARLQITVVDPSGAVIPAATIQVAGLEASTRVADQPSIQATDKGVGVIERLSPGRYKVIAEFPGFAPGVLADIRLRAGDNKHVIVLPLQQMEDSVSATRDVRAAASDRQASTFGLSLSRDQIDALADDPAEMQRQILEIAGPDAILRVDSFEGQQLPPKAHIKSIHVTRDQFAAEAAQPGSTFVDIITQPGVGPIRGNLNTGFRNGAMTSKSPFVSRRGPERQTNVNGNISGTLIEGRTGFSVSFGNVDQFVTPIVNIALPEGMRADAVDLRQPFIRRNASAQLDHALTSNQTLRVSFDAYSNRNENIGVGNYDLPERAYTNNVRAKSIRVQEAGPIGRRTFLNTRVFHEWWDMNTFSATDAPTIVVQDAFTRGGAQQSARVHSHHFSLASDVDHVRGIHSFRGGVQVDGGNFLSRYAMNMRGTYIFGSLTDYEAGKPSVYTQSVGTPTIHYVNVMGGVYVQDDIRVRPGLTLSPGVRYSLQKRIADHSALEPRFGFTWSPGTQGKTTLRGSAGIFHSFVDHPTMDRTLRQNGEAQREILMIDPVYPVTAVGAETTLPSNRYVLGDFSLQRNYRYSAGVDRTLSSAWRVNVLYNYVHQGQQSRGKDLNAPVNGVRPDSRYGSFITAVTDAEIRRHEVYANVALNLAPPSSRATVDWRRLSMNATYAFVRARNNSGGFFEVSPTDNVRNDWGPGPADAPYRVQVMLTSTQIRNLTANVLFFTTSGNPYTLTTGKDDNGDGFLNDRPAGVGLRTLRGDGMRFVNARLMYTFACVPGTARPGAAPAQPRYRLNVFVTANNLTNHLNPSGYSGNMRSDFFMKPTFAANTRRIDAGVGVSF